MTQVTQLAPFMQFRGLDDYSNNFQSPNVWRASARSPSLALIA
jgi:hypothetical protein